MLTHRSAPSALAATLVVALTACAGPSGAAPVDALPAAAAPASSSAATVAPAAVFIPDPDPRYAAAVTAVTPLAAGRKVSCAGVVEPAAMLAMTGDASRGPAPTAVVLRKFLEDDPWGGLDGVDRTGRNTNWLLLQDDAHRYVFAQRKGPVGIASVVVFTKKGNGDYVPQNNSTCELLLNSSSEHRATITSASVTGTTVNVHWLNGACGLDAPPDEVLLRVEQAWTPTGTHLLVVTRSNPAISAPASTDPGAAQTRWCGGVGIDSTAKLSLDKAPAGGRLYDDAGIPAALVDRQ